MLIYAHRGWSARYPENTLLAFSKAIELGVAGIELDVQLSSDGIPVVIHDRNLARTTNGLGVVDQMPLAELALLDAGNGEHIPTLKEVLDLVGDSVHLDIEIKAPDAGSAVLSELQLFPHVRFAVSSFDWHVLRNVREDKHSVELWPLVGEWDDALVRVAAELESPTVAIGNFSYSRDSAGSLHDAGLRAFIWTINDQKEANRVKSLGAYAICTDDPSLFAAK